MRPKKHRKVLNVTVDQELNDWVRRVSLESGYPISQVVDAYLKRGAGTWEWKEVLRDWKKA